MSERVNPPPSVSFPQRNPFKQGSKEWTFLNQLITALNSQRNIIEQLWRRTGGGEDLVADTAVRETYAWDVPEAQESNLNALFDSSEPPRVFNQDTKSSDYTLVSWDYINFTANATAKFPQYPGEGDKIRIRKGGGARIKLDGNGKNINGSSTGNIYRNGTNITFSYFIDTDEWFAE